MAIHTTLPIYKVAYDLLVGVTEATRNMPRDFKASIGTQIRNECVALSVLIFRANCVRDSAKVPHLTELLERLQVTELLPRLAQDLRLISQKQYAKAIRLTDSVGRQANAWRRSSSAAPAA